MQVGDDEEYVPSWLIINDCDMDICIMVPFYVSSCRA